MSLGIFVVTIGDLVGIMGLALIAGIWLSERVDEWRRKRKGFHVTLAIEEPEICGNIDVAVTAFKANDPDGRPPNLLILGPDEYKQLLGAIQTRSAVRIDVGDYRVETVTKKNYKGMRIIQATKPGLLVAKEGPFL